LPSPWVFLQPWPTTPMGCTSSKLQHEQAQEAAAPPNRAAEAAEAPEASQAPEVAKTLLEQDKGACVATEQKSGSSSATLTEEQLCKDPYNQAHLFKDLSTEECEAIVCQLNEMDVKLPGGGLAGYLTRARSLLADAKEGKNPFAGLKPSVPTGQNLTGEQGPGSSSYAEFENLGMDEISKCAFCLVAGGLGERLGYPGIKIGIVAELATRATFLEVYSRFILAFQAHARSKTNNASLELPFAIMTSGDTHEQTLSLLETNEFFGLQRNQVAILKQENVPALQDVNACISSTRGSIETKPHGHGDVHALLHQKGLTKQWAGEGCKWLIMFQDTNPLVFRSLCATLGVSVKNDFTVNSFAVPRRPGEAVGGIATLEDEKKGTKLTVNVEYNQLDPLLKGISDGGDVADESGFSPYPGNVNILIFKLPAMAEILDATGGIVPEFVNPKWADEERTKFKTPTRLECMMQDFPRLCGPDDKVGFTLLERGMCFTCVKNNLEDAANKKPADCALSAEADIYACNAHLLKLAGDDVEIEPPEDVSFLGVTAPVGARIILQPSFGISLEAMKGKVKGKIRISKRSTLIIEDNLSIDGLELDGALQLSGQGTVRNMSVSNRGQPWVAVRDEELDAQSPSIQIRGYRVGESELERVQAVCSLVDEAHPAPTSDEAQASQVEEVTDRGGVTLVGGLLRCCAAVK